LTIAHTSSLFLTDVGAAPDGQHGWVTGIIGTLLRTADAGRTWTDVDPDTDVNLGPVVALDADTAIVAGAGIGVSDVITEPEPHTVRRTDDAGATWSELDVDGFRASDIEFVDEEHGWIVGIRCDASPGTPTPSVGFCGSHSHAVLRSSDGGLSWRIVSEGREFTDIEFASEDVGYGVYRRCDGGATPSLGDCVSAIAATDDGGETWTDIRALDNPFRAPLAIVDDLLVAAVQACVNDQFSNCTGALIETDDGGETWTEIDLGDAFATDLAFAPAGHGLRISSGNVLTTSDRRAWTIATFPITVGRGAYDFIDANTGWFGASKLLHTTDAGETWQPVNDLQPVDLAFVSATEGWASTFDVDPATGVQTGTIQHTTDGGRTWTQQYARAFGNHIMLHFADARTGWAYSLYDALLLRTTDGGASWHELPLPADVEAFSPSIAFVDANVAWLAEPVCVNYNDDCVIRPRITRDGGVTWRALADIPLVDSCPVGISAIDASTAWITASECREFSRPYILRTRDGGASWQRTDLGVVGALGPITFFDARVGRGILSRCDAPPSGNCEDLLLRTDDGGATWTQTPTGLSEPQIFNYEFVAPGRAWRLIQTGGGLFAVSRHQLVRFVGPGGDAPPPRRPIVLPNTGLRDTYDDHEGHVQLVGALLLLMAAAAAVAYVVRRAAR
jgi:photosystem II stability/assembly factor-like uncharacterized protein